jgi:hypothetical protein
MCPYRFHNKTSFRVRRSGEIQKLRLPCTLRGFHACADDAIFGGSVLVTCFTELRPRRSPTMHDNLLSMRCKAGNFISFLHYRLKVLMARHAPPQILYVAPGRIPQVHESRFTPGYGGATCIACSARIRCSSIPRYNRRHAFAAAAASFPFSDVHHESSHHCHRRHLRQALRCRQGRPRDLVKRICRRCLPRRASPCPSRCRN